MARSTETAFTDSLGAANFQRTSVPFTTSIRELASDTFANVRGYLPVSSEPEEEEQWYQMSRMERIAAFALCLALGILCFFLAFFFFMPMIPIFPGKFAATFTLGSILILTSIALLRGPVAHIRHMCSYERLPFTLAYIGTMGLTLYASLGAHSYLLTILFAVLQLFALVWYFGSYFPGGISTLQYGSRYIGRSAISILPF